MYDEHYCPNCGATLEDQLGFVPDEGSWTCTECGTHLFDGSYEGDIYEDVAWYCDSCGAFLNKQFGFNDYCDYWECTECGHSNPISQDAIINNNYYNSTSTSFSSSSSASSSAGPLDVANSFVKLLNSIADIAIDIKKRKDKAAQEDKQRRENTSHSNTHSNSNQPKITYSKSYKYKKESKRELNKIRRKAFFCNGKRVQVGYDSNSLLRKNVNDVAALLFNQAFTKIKKISVKDIYVNSQYSVNEVEQIVIGGSQYFESTDMFPYDTEIIIVHHQKKKIKVRFSSESLHGLDYYAVVEKFRELGFTNIRERKIKDLLAGWLKSDGSVESVTISNKPFNKNTSHEFDAEIIIAYHTF